MPQIDSTNPPFKRNRLLITYKKVVENQLQLANKLVKSGYNHIILEEDQIFDISGVTSLEIDNIGETNVVVNGLLLLAFNDDDTYTNGTNELQKIVKRNSKTFVHGDGTFSDVSLDINFIYQEIEMVKTYNSGNEIGLENVAVIFQNENTSVSGIGLDNFVVYIAFNSDNDGSGSSGFGIGLINFTSVSWTVDLVNSGLIIGQSNFTSQLFDAVIGLREYDQNRSIEAAAITIKNVSGITCEISNYQGNPALALLHELKTTNTDTSAITVRSSITSFEVITQAYLSTLDLSVNHINTLNIDLVSGLQTLKLSTNHLESLDVNNWQGKYTLQNIDANSNWLTSVNLTGATNLINIDLSYNNLPSAVINDILHFLRYSGFTGTAKLYGGGNQAPTGNGIIDRDHLIYTGCQITTTTTTP